MADLIGSTPSEVRALGIRDLGSALLLVASPDARLPIALRVAFDVSDAARYGRGRPAVLAMTLGFAGLGVAGLLGQASVNALPTGATMRRTGPAGGLAVVCVNGGTGNLNPGDWSASLEWLVRRLAPRHPGLAFHEVRYRVKSWRRLDMCIEDARAALDEVAETYGGPVLMLGFSMGGGVSVAVAGHPAVTTVVGLAPWIPSASRWRECSDAASPSSRDRSTARFPASPGSARAARGRDASGCARWGSRPATGSSAARSTRSPYAGPAAVPFPPRGPAPGPGWWATS